MLGVTLEDVMAKHLLTNWVMWRARWTIGDTLSNVEAYAHADAKADTLAEENKRDTINRHYRCEDQGTVQHIGCHFSRQSRHTKK